MSLYSAMRSGVSGMSAQSSRMAAISDNISNSTTVGYKRAAVDFSTLVTSSSTTSYTAGGVSSNVRYEMQKDGTIQGTQSTTDLAIDGDGFFVVANASSSAVQTPSYALTRAGRFLPDDSGFLRNTAGQYLQGWPLNADGTLPTVSNSSFDNLAAINVGNLAYGGSATNQMSFSGNLPGQAATGDTFETTSVLYDGLGNPHEVKVTWEKTATANEWTLTVTPPAGTTPPAPYTAAPATATVTFDASGPTAGMPTAPIPPVTITSSAAPVADEITLSFANITQLNGDYVPQFTGNGAKAARVNSVQVDEGGKLWAIYDNGSTRALYQIPVANVVNPNGLQVRDGNTYVLGADSGALTLSAGNMGTAGSVIGSALESSNVDIADELVSLIETQRAYSSNATLVRTADEMVEETTRLKR